MFSVCVFAWAKRRSGEIAKFHFLIPANWGVITFSLQNVPESASNSGIFPYYFAVLGLVFELNRIWKLNHTLNLTLNHQKRVE